MSFWKLIHDFWTGSDNIGLEQLKKDIKEKQDSFESKPKENTAKTTSAGADVAHKTTLKKKNYKKTKINDTTVFVDNSVNKAADPAFQDLLAQKVKEAKAREEIPNAVAEFKQKEKKAKKDKKPKMTVEGNAKLLYTDEEWNNSKKPKGKK